ncbi:MAG: pyridoxal phosphate-dependent aminotransferase [Myxococcales bacterium]|nr:pyridoxal phosphate-dependent aminotransferase [Myxococcales bacterium]
MMRGSSRLDWGRAENALSRRHAMLQASGAPILDLTLSNPTRAGIPYPAQAIAAALADPRAILYQPAPQGLPEARQAIADYYASRGHPIDPERLLLTASTSEAYAFLFKLLADPDDEALVPHPSYPLFDFLAALESVRLRPYRLAYDGAWYLDADDLRRALSPRTRALLLCNPNNPTGSFLKRDELATLIAIASEHDLPLIADEVFSDYAFAPDKARVETLVAVNDVLTFSLSGLSKVVGLPQLKLGWIHVGGPPAEAAAALARLELIADTYLSVAAPVQHAAARLLDLRPTVGRAIALRVTANHRAVAAAVAVRGSAVDLLHAEGGWYATLRLPRIRSDEEWAIDLLDRDHLLVQPGYFFDFAEEAHLVVSLLTPPEILAEGIARLVARAAG